MHSILSEEVTSGEVCSGKVRAEVKFWYFAISLAQSQSVLENYFFPLKRDVIPVGEV